MKFLLTAVLFLGLSLAQGQSQDIEHWNIANVQLIAVKEIAGMNAAVVADKSAIIEVTGNVSYLPNRGAGIYTPFPPIKLVGASGARTFSEAPIAFGMNSPTGCHYFYFMSSIANVSRIPEASRLDVADSKVRFTGDGAVSLCFAFSTPPSSEMMHFEFSGLSVTPEVLTAPRRMIVAPSLGNLPTPTPPKCIPVEPSYTDEARKAHIQGPVTLDVVIHSNGAIEVTKVLTSLGYGLDEEAIAVLAKWKCTPGTVNGQPVNIRLKIVVNFHLN